MRPALAIAMTTLTLGLASRSIYGQIRAGDAPALETIHMIDSHTGWAVTDRRYVSVLLRTTDGGTHWRDVTPLSSSGSKIRVLEISVLAPLIAWVSRARSFGSTTTEVFRTIDGGRTWRTATIPARDVSSISFINSREGWLLAFLGAGTGKHAVEIYRSTNGGESWIKVASATPDDIGSGLPFHGAKTSITFLNPTTGWIGGMFFAAGGFYLYVTHDGGRTWRQQSVPVPRELTPHWRGFPQPPKFLTARDGILPVFYDILNDFGEDIGRVVVFYATHDGGSTWTHTTPLRVRVSDLVHQAVGDMNHAWVTNGRALHATSDGGRRWIMIRPNPLFVDVTQLDFVSPHLGWALRQKSPRILKTLDGGRTWTSLTYKILRQ